MARTLTLTEALRRLEGAGAIRSAWLPGMLTHNGMRSLASEGGRVAWIQSYTWANAEVVGSQPDGIVLTDAATVGCLLALWHEAGQAVAKGHLAAVGRCFDDLCSSTPFSTFGDGVARVGQALSDALIALAEAL